MKHRLKHLLGLFLARLGLYKLLFPNCALIVAFHRIDDRYPGDPLTCSWRDYVSFCDFFSRYHKVVSLGALLDALASNRSIRRCLVITFDDGYRDNHAAAAMLERWRLPACFFVATNFIGSDFVPWWDRKAGIRSEWMTWDEVRDLSQQGFEIGGHTATHADLGKVEPPLALAELTSSRLRLEAELGRRVLHFAYPYGRSDNMSDGSREAVREAGYACCLAANGGLVWPGTDPFRLNRTAISPWYRSPYQLGFEVLATSIRVTIRSLLTRRGPTCRTDDHRRGPPKSPR